MPITIYLSIVVSKLCKQNKPMVMTLKAHQRANQLQNLKGEERMDSQLFEVKDEEEEFVVEQNW